MIRARFRVTDSTRPSEVTEVVRGVGETITMDAPEVLDGPATPALRITIDSIEDGLVSGQVVSLRTNVPYESTFKMRCGAAFQIGFDGEPAVTGTLVALEDDRDTHEQVRALLVTLRETIAAAPKGDWELGYSSGYQNPGVHTPAGPLFSTGGGRNAHSHAEREAACIFVAAFNPQTALLLVETVEHLLAQQDRLSTAIDELTRVVQQLPTVPKEDL